MATQDDNGIPLSSAPDGRGYRLLELPPEVESILTSPGAPVLYLTQPDNATSALLEVPGGKTYAMQQKNTSNALLLLTHSPNPSTASTDNPRGLTAVATLHETVELVPQAPTIDEKLVGKWHERFGKNR